MSRFHKIDLIMLSLALATALAIAVLGILYNRDLVALAAVIASAVAPLGTAYGLCRSAEWKARAADQSSLVEQEQSATHTPVSAQN